MFRDVLSNRGLIAGLVVFVLIVSGSLLYSWHVRRASEAEFQRGDRFLQGLEKKSETRTETPATQPVEIETPDFVSTPEEHRETPMSDETKALENETETLDFADALLPDDFVSEEASAEDVPVSPFGFGPYPEVPTDYFGEPIWTLDSGLPYYAQREIELIDRVLIKLWQQGDRSIVGGSTYKGKILPHYKNTAYIRWSESVSPDGTIHRYISRVKGALDAPTAEEIEAGDIPPSFNLVDLDDAGIDPYQFLDLEE